MSDVYSLVLNKNIENVFGAVSVRTLVRYLYINSYELLYNSKRQLWVLTAFEFGLKMFLIFEFNGLNLY